MSMQLDSSAIAEAFRASLKQIVAGERGLSAQAAAEVDALVTELTPLVIQETQAMATSADPQVQQIYLGVLRGAVEATLARLGLVAIEQQRQLIVGAVATAVQVLAAALKVAVAA